MVACPCCAVIAPLSVCAEAIISMSASEAHRRPPIQIRAVYKKYQKSSPTLLAADTDILDFERGLTHDQLSKLKEVRRIPAHLLLTACSDFGEMQPQDPLASGVDVLVFEHDDLPGKCIDIFPYMSSSDNPGLQFAPSLLCHETQRLLLSRLLHRDLADEQHKTNIHLHHHVPYRAMNANTEPITMSDKNPSLLKHETSSKRNESFFNYSPNSSKLLLPINADVHKPITVSQFLRRKLRWLTLGGQYNWTSKEYPSEAAPQFPKDIAALVHSLFPDMRPEAAIVNLYTPGDTLSVHRDISEESRQGLVSISLGCDGIFVIGLEDDGAQCLTTRLSSGDAIYMSGAARLAWHGVPHVLANTCPAWLSDWPASATSATGRDSDTSTDYEDWRGWMSTKRVNLNIRQMKD